MYCGARDPVTGSLCPPASFEWSMSVISSVGGLDLGVLMVAGSEVVAGSEYREMALGESGA